jgi:hypothetical protein
MPLVIRSDKLTISSRRRNSVLPSGSIPSSGRMEDLHSITHSVCQDDSVSLDRVFICWTENVCGRKAKVWRNNWNTRGMIVIKWTWLWNEGNWRRQMVNFEWKIQMDWNRTHNKPVDQKSQFQPKMWPLLSFEWPWSGRLFRSRPFAMPSPGLQTRIPSTVYDEPSIQNRRSRSSRNHKLCQTDHHAPSFQSRLVELSVCENLIILFSRSPIRDKHISNAFRLLLLGCKHISHFWYCGNQNPLISGYSAGRLFSLKPFVSLAGSSWRLSDDISCAKPLLSLCVVECLIRQHLD